MLSGEDRRLIFPKKRLEIEPIRLARLGYKLSFLPPPETRSKQLLYNKKVYCRHI